MGDAPVGYGGGVQTCLTQTIWLFTSASVGFIFPVTAFEIPNERFVDFGICSLQSRLKWLLSIARCPCLVDFREIVELEFS
jgi:hypothetical protein